VANRGADVSIRRPAPLAHSSLIGTPPVRIVPNCLIANANRLLNRRKTAIFESPVGLGLPDNHRSPITSLPAVAGHRRSNRNCHELEMNVNPLSSSKLSFLIATASGGQPDVAVAFSRSASGLGFLISPLDPPRIDRDLWGRPRKFHTARPGAPRWAFFVSPEPARWDNRRLDD
jgi:hypothetical protein